MFALATQAIGADTLKASAVAAATDTLAGYLQKLGYHAVKLRRTEGNGLAANTEINGKHRTLIVDTGAPLTYVRDKALSGLKSVREQGITLHDEWIGDVRSGNFYLLERLKIGEAVFANQPVKRDDLTQFEDMDGLLGLDFMLRNHCLLECTSPVLYVRPQSLPGVFREGFELSLRKSGYVEVPLTGLTDLRLICEVMINTNICKMAVDSGAFWSHLRLSTAMLQNLTVTRTNFKTADTLKMLDNVKGVQIKSLGIGDLVLKDYHLVVESSYKSLFTAGDATLENLDGMIGADILGLQEAIIDPEGAKLWLKAKGRRIN